MSDEIACGFTPSLFQGVGAWYEDFTQTSDEEVRQLLSATAAPGSSTRADSVSARRTRGR